MLFRSSERVSGRRVASPGRRGGARQAGREEVEAGGGQGGVGARHRAASVRGEEDDRWVSGGGLGRQLELGQVG